MSSLSYGHKTDVGRQRKNNQDSLAVIAADGLDHRVDGLFVVADGMGGYAGGEIASRVTVETVPAVVREVLAEHNGHVNDEALVEAVREALDAANDAVRKQARANPELRGMGTTCVAALVRDGVAAVANIGDSRAYLLRDGGLIQLTQDHSLVQEHVRAGDLTAEEARASRFRNVITRAIGIADSVEPDMDLVELREGDTLLLCSDGLTTMVDDQEIAYMLSTCADPQETCEKLVNAANKYGGADNITAVVVRHGQFTPLDLPPPPRDDEESAYLPLAEDYEGRAEGVSPVAFGLLLLLVLVLGGALVYVGWDRYRLTAGWPFLREQTPAPPKPTAPPPPDFGNFLYGRPQIVLNKPVRGTHLACDAQGNVYVTTASGKIKRVSRKGELTGEFGVLIPSSSRTPEIFWAADSQGYLYVSSKADRCIYKYDANGTRRAVIGEGELERPEAIAVDGSGSLYVVDANRLKVLRAFSPDQARDVQLFRRSGVQEESEQPTNRRPTTDDRASGAPPVRHPPSAIQNRSSRTPERRTPNAEYRPAGEDRDGAR